MMLSEVLDAAAPTTRRDEGRVPGISMSSLFPCAYRLRLVHDGRYWPKGITSQQYYNMNDGHDQEDQSVRRLKAAGITIRNRQRLVHVGNSLVPGHYDGDFDLKGITYLWEHKAYDSLAEAIQVLRMWGINKLPSQKAQTNGYMLGAGLQWCDFFVKVKNNNTYIDVTYQIDRPFIEEIVQWCDDIRLRDWKPQPKECDWCSLCGVNCFEEVLDFSWIAAASETEAVDKWVRGKQFVDIGKMMQEEADEVFLGVRAKDGHILQRGLIGDKDELHLPGMTIKKIVSHPFRIDKSLILEHFGPEGLIQVGREETQISYRHYPEA